MTHSYPSRKLRRKLRISRNIKGTDAKPRIAVYRSSKYIYAQAIDDIKKTTITACSVKKAVKPGSKLKKSEAAFEVGKKLGQQLLEKNIKTAVFDRSRFTYLGRVKQLAEGIRAAGIIM